MTNKEVWSNYRSYTEDLTKQSRQLALGAAAICWFFKRDPVSFPVPVIWSLAFVVVFFLADLLQFFTSAHLLRWWIRREEQRQWKKKRTLEGEYEKPWYLDQPAFLLFNAKIIALAAAFVALGLHFLRLLRTQGAG